MRPLAAVLMFVAAGAFAQAADDFQGSTWIVSVDGEYHRRVLVVDEVGDKPDGLVLSARYGWIDGKLFPAKVAVAGGKLEVLTNADSRIESKGVDANTFEGTFTGPKGKGKSVRIVKASQEEVARVAAAASPGGKPLPDVPAQCAAFHGAWEGTWPVSGTMHLWVAGIDASCLTGYGYGSAPIRELPAGTNLRTARIEKGRLTFPCGTGICMFTLDGDELRASYSGGDGAARTVFVRMK